MDYATMVNTIAEWADVPKTTVKNVLKSFSEATKVTLEEGGEIGIPGLGKFKVIERAARKGVNPRTGKKIKIPAKKAPKFVPAKALKDAVR